MPILLLCQTIVKASLQWLKLIFPMLRGNIGGKPGLAVIGISKGSILNIVDSDFLKYPLVSKKTFDLTPESFSAALISSAVTTSCTPLIS